MRHRLLLTFSTILLIGSTVIPPKSPAQSLTPSLHRGRSFLFPYFAIPNIPGSAFLGGSGFTSQSPAVTALAGGLPRFTDVVSNATFSVPNDAQFPQTYLLQNTVRPIFPRSDTIVRNAALGIRFDRPSEVLFDVGAYKALPENALGREYCVMARNGYYDPNLTSVPTAPRERAITHLPSYIVILAVEDSTEVLITPRFATFSLGNRSRTILLRRNEAYTVQAEASLANQYGDLTGTRITGNKPIAVFAGTQGGSVPTPIAPGNAAGLSFMSEQQTPVSTWGKDALLVPLIAPSQEFLSDLRADIELNSLLRRIIAPNQRTLPPRLNTPQYARILAGYNNTEVFRVGAMGNERITTLQAGEFAEITFATATFIRASQPILVAQWANRQDLSGLSTAMFIRPTSQYATVQTMATIRLAADSDAPPPTGTSMFSGFVNGNQTLIPVRTTFRRFSEDYFTIIARLGDTANVRLDGERLQNTAFTSNRFVQIDGTDFALATTAVTRGLHTVSSNLPIMVMAHGGTLVAQRITDVTNSANTYFGGPILFQSGRSERIAGYAYSGYGDLQHERRAEALGYAVQDCYTMDVGVAAVQDASGQNAGNRALQTVQTSGINCAITAQTPTQNTDSVRLRATLQNPFADGTFTVNTTEGNGAQFSQSYTIGGFTLNVDDRREAAEPLVRTVRLCADTVSPTCVPVRLTNYGSQTQILRRVSLRSSANLNMLGVSTLLRDFRVREITNATLRAVPATVFQRPQELFALQTLATRAAFTVSTVVSASILGDLRRELRAETASRIDPQTNSDLTFCYTASRTASYQDTLFVSDGCRERAVLVLNIVTERDTTPPRLTRVIDSCRTSVQLRFDRNSGQCSRGIAGGEILQSQNVSVVRSQGSTNATGQIPTGQTLSYTATVQNPRQDAFYTLIVRDSLGNVRVIRDTIPGFTIQVRSNNLPDTNTTIMPSVSALPILNLGRVPITSVSCQTLTILNTGVIPTSLDAIRLAGNITVSIPPQELLRTLQTNFLSGIPQTLTVCASPPRLGRYVDTLTFRRGCVSTKFVVVYDAATLEQSAASRCEAEVRLTTASAPQSFFIEQNFPNPASNQLLVRVNLNEQALTTMQITNSFGVVIKTLLSDVLSAGRYEVSAEISNISSGIYFLTVESGKYRQSKQITIVR